MEIMMTVPNTVRALRILLYVLMAIVVVAIVGIALQYYPGWSVLRQVLHLLPALASVVQVFYLRPGRGILRITLTVTLSVYTVASCYGMLTGSPGAIIGLALGAAMLVLLHQRSAREWFAGTTSTRQELG
ncbi:hypothetical protein [Streptomyces sp. NPDC005096]|uniref:hypothetical protein n=1 Tax=Streptomyces sp. NPDC005096 TaxID=3154559 RepID=UPI0033A3AA9D